MNKKEFGQFFTTNYKYILKNIKLKFSKKNNIKSDKSERIIIEPFCGNGDLLQHLDDYKNPLSGLPDFKK